QVNRSGLIGTIYYDDGVRKQAAENTTPGPEVLQALFSQMVENKASYCVMEVSSHALDQNRVEGIDFSSVVFTNLTQDHLDYHKNYEDYYQAKRKLFFGTNPPGHSVINGDDSYGTRLAGELKGRSQVATYGVSQTCSYRIREIQLFSDRVKFELLGKGKAIEVSAPLILRHNVYNVASALVTLAEEGFDLKELVLHLTSFPGVPGRLEQIDEGQDFSLFVDYAHTPDGLYNVLSSLEGLPKNRVVSVFGCGGDRDRAKRPIMAEIATRYSDVVILTSDNPRSEIPEAILEEIELGVEGSKRTKVVTLVDREEAIRYAIHVAQRGDLVFIFGKGHEHYQIFGKEKRPFSDQEVTRYWLKQRCLPSTKSHKLAVEN
ncbi:MAG: UDP-N-acetylmuramoyl-L-alanyl-D-glutamate--2,6-diaminopimelate ligase, partial [Candidatus Omnitrophica bacterium]|nr:UDP-N-acetylmuramoyl-L-alanyl-D-glutamate--2,6-diaminopimelate ligase [Candidatus Omnitrophota bacterium]